MFSSFECVCLCVFVIWRIIKLWLYLMDWSHMFILKHTTEIYISMYFVFTDLLPMIIHIKHSMLVSHVSGYRIKYILVCCRLYHSYLIFSMWVSLCDWLVLSTPHCVDALSKQSTSVYNNHNHMCKAVAFASRGRPAKFAVAGAWPDTLTAFSTGCGLSVRVRELSRHFFNNCFFALSFHTISQTKYDIAAQT